MAGLVLAALIGGAITLLFDHLKQRLSRPILVMGGVDFVDDETRERTFRVVIHNRGKTSAKACVAQISICPIGDPFRIQPIGVVGEDAVHGGTVSLTDQPLVWTGQTTRLEAEIYASLSRRLDLCSAQVGSPLEHVGYTIPSETGFQFPLIVFSCPGFAFLVKVAGENTRLLAVSGYVRWDPNDPTVEYVDDIVQEFLTPITPYTSGFRANLPRWLQRNMRGREQKRRVNPK